MAKKKVVKKKKSTKSTSAAKGPSEPIQPKVCPNCGALYTPLKASPMCSICTQAQAAAITFSLPAEPSEAELVTAEAAAETAAAKAAKKTTTSTTKKKSVKKKSTTKKK
ncbi:uncharacterized protein MONBRDRAFT_11788 [Monosiga brevicollis MX1]|uniref:Uncharacterized protein n=1 Tax=Monosiga brevicollis TaxID=81824 RepID=A9VAA4_MONBE|nr:uncharacterized protein MONBRDRAFT_11788 [Monosiga brevicollis MX1]EDQ85506.1 predicted protein [Monosiga brevicollis MX1]|eukprot:XP_001749697.1 hypothetical protein [Monosiga brevicollis MX1]